MVGWQVPRCWRARWARQRWRLNRLGPFAIGRGLSRNGTEAIRGRTLGRRACGIGLVWCQHAQLTGKTKFHRERPLNLFRTILFSDKFVMSWLGRANHDHRVFAIALNTQNIAHAYIRGQGRAFLPGALLYVLPARYDLLHSQRGMNRCCWHWWCTRRLRGNFIPGRRAHLNGWLLAPGGWLPCVLLRGRNALSAGLR